MTEEIKPSMIYYNQFSNCTLKDFKRVLDIAEKYFNYSDYFSKQDHKSFEDKLFEIDEFKSDFLRRLNYSSWQKIPSVMQHLNAMRISVDDVQFFNQTFKEREKYIMEFYKIRDEDWRDSNTIYFEDKLFITCQYFIRRCFETLNMIFFRGLQSNETDKYSRPNSAVVSYTIQEYYSEQICEVTLNIGNICRYNGYVKEILGLLLNDKSYKIQKLGEFNSTIFKLDSYNLDDYHSNNMHEDFMFFDDRMPAEYVKYDVIGEKWFFILCAALGVLEIQGKNKHTIKEGARFMFLKDAIDVGYTYCNKHKRLLPSRVEKNTIL
jgi:hypothetical protein